MDHERRAPFVPLEVRDLPTACRGCERDPDPGDDRVPHRDGMDRSVRLARAEHPDEPGGEQLAYERVREHLRGAKKPARLRVRVLLHRRIVTALALTGSSGLH